jgi:hypothetical protein
MVAVIPKHHFTLENLHLSASLSICSVKELPFPRPGFICAPDVMLYGEK